MVPIQQQSASNSETYYPPPKKVRPCFDAFCAEARHQQRFKNIPLTFRRSCTVGIQRIISNNHRLKIIQILLSKTLGIAVKRMDLHLLIELHVFNKKLAYKKRVLDRSKN